MIPIAKPFIGKEEKQAVLDVLDSGMIAQGKRTAELERQFADLCTVKHAIATSSGTTALHTALLAHGIGPGDEVITTPFTFIASVNSILYCGAKPVLVDIDPVTFNIDPVLIKKAITPKTKAIMPVHIFGQICDMDAINALADEYDLVVIEDACQAVKATYKGETAGSFGTGCFSLYATKNMMSAEGGMITTDDDDYAEQCRLLRNHGMKKRYHYEMLGFNFRMTDIQAAIGLQQILRLDGFIEKRRDNAGCLSANIRSVGLPMVIGDRDHVWHQYTIRIDRGRDRDKAVEQLNKAGVGTGIFYPIPAHKHPYMVELLGDLHLPEAELASQEVVSIPVHPQLNHQDLNQIIEAVNQL